MKVLCTALVLLVITLSGADAQQLAPRLARVGVVEVEGQPPVLEVVANAPLAFNVLRTGRRLDIRIYGVEAGLVPLDQPSAFGRVTLRREKRGDVVLRLTPPRRAAEFNVRTGARPNVIEITAR